jgi:hypothetical protein
MAKRLVVVDARLEYHIAEEAAASGGATALAL